MPLCIRLEYAPKKGFVDEPTLFAANRGVRALGTKISRTANSVSIDTGKMRLRYRNDGLPFNAANLEVSFLQGTQSKSWKPGQVNSGQLGGPLSTLDFLSGPVNLPPALLSRDGWALVDDSGKAIRPDGWIAPRPGGGPPSADNLPKNADLDWYLFAYGNDYHGALKALATVSGRVPMPRKEVLGSWYCRFYPYSSSGFRELARGYEQHDFPLDIMVMDMDWHTRSGATSTHLYAGDAGWTGYTWNRQLLPDAEKLIGDFKERGIFVPLNDHPHDGVRDHEEAYPDFMRSLGQTPAKGNNVEFNAGDKRYMDAFFAAAHNSKEAAGVDFWWLDWQQDGIFPWVKGVPGLRHLPWLNELYYAQSQKAGLRGQSYSRWGGWGDQRHPIYFSGDATGSWAMLGFEVPFTAASGNAGCFFWAHDTGAIFGKRGTLQATAPTTDQSRTSVKIYRCPSDTGPELNPEAGNFAVSNYRATCGSNATRIYTAFTDYGGVMFQNSRTGIVDILDGTSNTLLVGEGKYDKARLTVGGVFLTSAVWNGMTGHYSVSGLGPAIWIDNVMWPTNVNATYAFDTAFNSNHTGTVNFLFCDGAVRGLSNQLDPNVRALLGLRADGQVVQVP